MTTPPIYNLVGSAYMRSRRADPRIVDELVWPIGLPAGSRIADIGVDTGKYGAIRQRESIETGYRFLIVPREGSHAR
jgi:hypothetical protein